MYAGNRSLLPLVIAKTLLLFFQRLGRAEVFIFVEPARLLTSFAESQVAESSNLSVGLVVRDTENSYLNLPVDDEDSLLQLQGASVSYRIAMGPQQGQKVFTLQTLPASADGEYGQLANTSGFSVHAGVFASADEPEKLERLCRYISRPAISEQRLSVSKQGQVRYELKTPYRDGTTHVFFNPIDFIGKLAALIPPPRINLTRFYGVFAPNSKLRAQVTSSKRGKNSPKLANKDDNQIDKPYQARSWSR